MAVAGRLLSAHAYLACAPFCRLYASGEYVVLSFAPTSPSDTSVVPSATNEKCVASCCVGPAGLAFPLGFPWSDLALPKQSASSGSSWVGKTDALVSLVLPPYGTRPTVSMCEWGVHVLCRWASGPNSLSSSGMFSGWASWCPSSRRGFVGPARVGDARGVGRRRGHGRDGRAPLVRGALHVEALRGLLGHGRADGGMVRVVAVEEGMAVRVHLRDGHATPHGRLLHVRDGRGERGADNLGAARRALICGDGRGDQAGADCRVMEDLRETTLA